MADKDYINRRNLTILNEVLEGQSFRKIAANHNISFQRVSQIVNNEQYKQILEQGQKEQLLMLPRCNVKLDEHIGSEDENVSLKAIALVMKNTGITPTHAQGVFIQNLQLIGTQINLDSRISTLLGDNMPTNEESGNDIIDIEEI